MSTSKKKRERRLREKEAQANADVPMYPSMEVDHRSVSVGEERFFVTLKRKESEWLCHGSIGRHTFERSGPTKNDSIWEWKKQGSQIIEEFGMIDERDAWLEAGNEPIEDRGYDFSKPKNKKTDTKG